MKIGKLLSFGLAGNLILHGAANAHVHHHLHTHSDLLIGLALVVIGLASYWLLVKGPKG